LIFAKNIMIGVFDSGIGGLTLLKEMRHTLPHEHFLYYADTQNVPYSYKTTEQILEFVENAVLFLIKEGCKAIVLACNTATNVSIAYLRAKYSFPIVAIQPAIKVAFDHNRQNKRILACATPVTLQADRFENLITSLDINHLIDRLPLPKLVEFAEQEIFDQPEVLDYLKTEFGKFDLQNYHYVVLGCTHFTYFEGLIKKNFPYLKPVDGNQGTARHLKNTLASLHLLTNQQNEGSVRFIESGKYATDETRFWRFLRREPQ
jgi:glutamate racemase